MDNGNPFFQMSPRRTTDEHASERQRKGTISVSRKPRKDDQKWHGDAPRLVPETDKRWRPSEFRF